MYACDAEPGSYDKPHIPHRRILSNLRLISALELIVSLPRSELFLNDHIDLEYYNMPLSELFKRQKDKFKRALARNSSSASLPNPSSALPPASPVPQAVVNEGLGDTATTLTSGQPATVEPPAGSPIGSPSIKSLPTLDIGAFPVRESDKPAVEAPIPPLDDTANTEAKAQGMEWSGLKRLIRILKSGAGIFGPLESALEGLERCMDIFEETSKARNEYQELGKKLDQLLGDLAEFNNAWMGKAMTASVKNLCSGIEAEIKVIDVTLGEQGLSRYLAATEDSDAILECHRRINGHVERLLLNANLNMWKTLDEEMTDRRLLQISPNTPGAYNSCASDRTKRRPCADGTRELVLERLKAWVHDPSAKPVYWINGMAGTGKTTIAYTLCDELDETDELAASFFCTRLLRECRDIRLIIPAIAYQLTRFSYPFRHSLSKVVESDPMAHTRDLKHQFQTLITSPLEAVRHTLPPGTIVVIDALDECEDRDNIEKLLELLIASTTNSPIRFLVSSRPEPEIYRRMMQQVGGSFDARLVLHELDPFDVQQDIGIYLRQELRELPLTSEHWDGLLQRCGTLFIYASTACRFIKYGDEMMSFEESMDMVLGLSTGTGDTEKELDELYMAVLDSAFNTPQINDANKKLMKTVLDTVICAQEPMTTEVLAGLLELKNAEHARRLLRPLLSVVNVTEDTGLVTTLHASFPDFMLSADRSAGFHCAATQHHITLALACLKQIKLNPVQFNICGIESSYLRDHEIKGIRERAKRAISPGLYYACCYWYDHLELAEYSTDFQEPVFDFLSGHFFLWLEVMLLYSGRPLDFNKVAKWCREVRMPKEIIELAQDAWQFIMYYMGMTSLGISGVYFSALLFWPSTSPISKHYMPRTIGLPQLQGPAITQREFTHLASWHIGDLIQTVCYSADGTHVVTAVGNDIHLVDPSTGRTTLGPLTGHTDLVTCLAVSLTGSYIASGSYDATIRVWNANSGNPITDPLIAHHDRVTSVAFSTDGTRIVSTGAFDPIRIWSVQTGEQMASTSYTSEPLDCIRTAVFSGDGSLIISGDDNGSIGHWDAYTGSLISRQSSQHSARINSVAVSSDGLRLLSASEDGTMYVWDTETRQSILGPLGRSTDYKTAIFSPDNQYIALFGDHAISLWDVETGKMACLLYREYKVFELNEIQVKSISFSPDGSRLVSCTNNGTISIWDMQSAINTAKLTQGHGIHSACFTSDGSHIVTGGRNGTICLWDVNIGTLVIGPLTGHHGYICSIAISSDGVYIASASSDKTIRLWDVKCAKCTCKVIEHYTKRADFLKFTADGSQLLYGSVVYSIGDLPFSSGIAPASRGNARDEWAAEVLTSNVCCNASSPDGSFVASGSADGTVQAWDSKTGQIILGPVQAHTQAVSRILFSPDGTHIVSCSLDNTMRFWPIPGKSKREALGSDSADTGKGTGTSPSPNLNWKLDDEGRIINDSDQVLLRVPQHLIPYLLLPENDRLISHRGWFSIDFTGANIGELWTRCYHLVQ